MTYKDYITAKCSEYAKIPGAVFIGYNTAKGSRMYGTLDTVPPTKCIETPVTENLMVGLAMGLAIKGMRPVLCFERHDFLLLALDGIVNHIDKLPYLSDGQLTFPIVIRAIIGGKSPLNAGPQHTNNYRKEITALLKYSMVYTPSSKWYFDLAWGYSEVAPNSGTVIIIESKDKYDKEIY